MTFFSSSIPDVLGRNRGVFENASRVVLVGGGYSAATVLMDLVKLGEELEKYNNVGRPAFLTAMSSVVDKLGSKSASKAVSRKCLEVVWLLRSSSSAKDAPYDEISGDPLPGRGDLVKKANEI